MERLAAEFELSEVKQRAGRGSLKLDYISIDSTINRLNDVLGFDWSTVFIGPTTFKELDSGRYLCVISLGLSISGSTRVGIGASTGSDPDDTVKTALAEAIKKAANQFGVALYLWDEGKRAEIEQWRKENKAGARRGSKASSTEIRKSPEPFSSESFDF